MTAPPAGPEALDSAWLEALLRSRSFPMARLRRVTHEIIGVGFGLKGTSARVMLEGDGVPKTLVVKWAPTKDVQREAHFYEVLAPRLTLRLAQLHGHVTDDRVERGVLVLEDMVETRQGDILIGATPDEADALVDAMARLHARFWDASDADVASLPSWDEVAKKRLSNLAETLPVFLAEWRGRVPDAAFAFATDLVKRTEDAYGELRMAPPTLVHGDLHLDNVLFGTDGMPIVIDWPSASRGPAAADFGHFLAESMSPALRRARQRALAERHLAMLAAHGVIGYTAEALRRDAERVMVILFGAAIRWVAGPNAPRPDAPRAPRLADSLLRNTALAVVEGLA
jgi:aminoglycoside phosphotransferase (APT) family kinase protein